jgi:UDP-glucose:(heptosyl)LPS alpha-1,3-glucosyltransferase
MKIALVVHDFDPRYGQGRYAVELARHLAYRHQVHIYSNTFGVPMESGVAFHAVRASRGNTLLRVLTFLGAAERQLRRARFDVVHAQGLSSWGADVITAHICNEARLRRSAGQNGSARVFQRLIAGLERRFYQQTRPRQLIAVSRHVADDIATSYAWSRPSTVIYHGIDTAKFRPPQDAMARAQGRQHFGLKADTWVWLFAGEAIKGLAQVMEQLREFPAAELLVVSRSSLGPHKAAAKSIGVQDRICFHGPEENMPLAYAAVDVLAYPSDYDAFALVVSEAMASGLPVIAGQNIGAAEWIQPQINGLLCDPADPATLRGQLQWLESNSARAHALGLAARETAKLHTWGDCARATEAVYRTAISKGVE